MDSITEEFNRITNHDGNKSQIDKADLRQPEEESLFFLMSFEPIKEIGVLKDEFRSDKKRI